MPEGPGAHGRGGLPLRPVPAPPRPAPTAAWRTPHGPAAPRGCASDVINAELSAAFFCLLARGPCPRISSQGHPRSHLLTAEKRIPAPFLRVPTATPAALGWAGLGDAPPTRAPPTGTSSASAGTVSSSSPGPASPGDGVSSSSSYFTALLNLVTKDRHHGAALAALTPLTWNRPEAAGQGIR